MKKSEVASTGSNEAFDQHAHILQCLADLPKKMMSLQNNDNVQEFVLHELCHDHCFNLTKAAFFVDSPDFNVLKGVVGISKAESYFDSIWDDPKAFSEHMQQSSFNRLVKDFAHHTIISADLDGTKTALTDIAQRFDFHAPAFHIWSMRYGNSGYLIYDHERHLDEFQDQFNNSLYLLSFCPLF